MKFKKMFGRKKQNRRAPRANEFMLESLEPRLLLSATPMTAAVVTTDHLDYAPGETAVITSSSQAGELVHFQVDRTDGMADVASTTAGVGPAGNEAWYVIDGIGGFTAHLGADVSGDGVADWIAPDNDLTANSSISTTWFVEEQYRNSSLLVTATGQESGAVATQAFTDANLNTTTVVTSSGASTYGDFVTLTATVTPAVGGTTNPVGSVEFFDNGVSIGSTISAGIGAGSSSTFALTVSSLTAGSHAITAVFTGGANVSDSFNNSASGIFTQTVSQKALVGNFSVVDISNPRFYDGTTNATVTFADLTGLIDGDFVTLDGGIATFDNANAGLNHVVTLTGATLGQPDASNYFLASVNTSLADIDQATAVVTVNGFTGAFDGLPHGATGTVVGVDAGGAALGSTLDLGAQFTLVGTYVINWVFDGGTNYTNQTGSVAIVISDAVTTTTTTVSSSAATSTYGDAVTFTATVSAGSGILAPTGTVAFFDGATLLGTDSVVDSTGVGTSTWSFTTASLKAGAHAIHAVYSATGSFSGSQSADISQTVNQKSLTGSFTAANKVYDGTTGATLTRLLTGVLGVDAVNLTGTGTFDTKDAGTGKVVTITGIGLTGADASNYSLTANSTTTANITALGLTGSFTAANKVYDGTTAATLTRLLTGVLGVDAVSLTGTGTFDTKDAGTGKVVTITGIGLTGADASNYS
ncbi:MAG: LEPR-XLL domain-containing protein, partial [Nitrospiraceae bacterium]|nr:LEPR-XLL domain-containing protein [Nitrospiraceae bacterium]